MIFVTSDCHCPIDINKLNIANFPQQKILTKQDYVIVCGDAGFVWNSSPEELWWRTWIEQRNFTTLFIDGNHDNHYLLAKYPVAQWCGGNAHFINDSLIHLMRGQVFTIENKKFFTMGGAESIDKSRRIEGVSWWKEELPNKKEYDIAMTNLDVHNWSVDYVLTHECSNYRKNDICNYMNLRRHNQESDLCKFFDMLDDNLTFTEWMFGHYHFDKKLTDKHTVLFDKVIRIL